MFKEQRKIDKLLNQIKKNSQKAIKSNFTIDTSEDQINCYLELTKLGYDDAYIEVAEWALLSIKEKNDKFYKLALEYSWLAYEKGYDYSLIIRAETNIRGLQKFSGRSIEELIAEENEIERELLFLLNKDMPVDYAVRARKALLRLYDAEGVDENIYYQAFWRYMLYFEFCDVDLPDIHREAVEGLREYLRYVERKGLDISPKMIYEWENEPYPNFNNL